MDGKNFGPIQIAIILLVVATAAIHIYLGLPGVALPGGLPMFLRNGAGYLALVAALYLPPLRRYHTYIRWALIAFTAITVLAWVAIGQHSLIAYIDKVIEVTLIILLFVEARREPASARGTFRA